MERTFFLMVLPNFCFDCLQPCLVIIYYFGLLFLKIRFLDSQLIALLVKLKSNWHQFRFELKLLSFAYILYSFLASYSTTALYFLLEVRFHRTGFCEVTCVHLFLQHACLYVYFLSQAPLQKLLIVDQTAAKQWVVDYVSLYPVCLFSPAFTCRNFSLIHILHFLVQLLEHSCLPTLTLFQLCK